jgi:hypothetical protein
MWGSPSCPEAYVQTRCSECDGEGQQRVRVEAAGDFIEELHIELDHAKDKAAKAERALQAKIYALEAQLRKINAEAV